MKSFFLFFVISLSAIYFSCSKDPIDNTAANEMNFNNLALGDIFKYQRFTINSGDNVQNNFTYTRYGLIHKNLIANNKITIFHHDIIYAFQIMYNNSKVWSLNAVTLRNRYLLLLDRVVTFTELQSY